MKRHTVPTLVAPVALFAASAAAQVTDFNVTYTPGTLEDGSAAIANVLAIDFAGQYTGSQMYVELDEGQILNQQFFSTNIDTAPSSVIAEISPDVNFDTYLAQGARFSDDPEAEGTPLLGGGVTKLPGEAPISGVFNDPTVISQSWNPAGGTNIVDRSGFVVAQLAFTPDASGRFFYYASAGGAFFDTDNFTSGRDPGYQVLGGRVVTAIAGDYDSSGHVGQGDLDLVLVNWGVDTDEAGIPAGWINDLPTGPVSQNELDGVLANWGDTGAPDFLGTAVPEPAAALSAGLAVLLAGRRRRA